MGPQAAPSPRATRARSRWRATLFAIVTGACACRPSGDIPVVTIPPEPKAEGLSKNRTNWKIGAYLSLSGPSRARSIEMKEGIDLAAQEINEAGGVKGRTLEIAYADDKSNPSLITNKVVELMFLQRVVALLGDVSARSMSAGDLADKNGIVLLSPASVEDEVTQIGPFVFRACAAANRQARLAAGFVVDTLGKKRIGLVYPSDEASSVDLARAFRDEAVRLGAEIVIERELQRDEHVFSALLVDLMDAGPDVVYAPAPPALMARLARTAMIAGLGGGFFMGSDAWGSEELWREAGEAVEGAFFTDHWAPDVPWPAARTFVTQYRDRYQREPTAYSALGYDAAKLLAQAIERAQAATPSAIRDALAETAGFQGVTGTMTIDPSRGVEKPVIVRRIERKKISYFATLPLSAAQEGE
jgi:branched-chain amino acid transport system substrate-binding protein